MLSDSNASVPKFKIVKVKEVSEDTHTECGSDCWQCHDIKKVSNINIPEHKVLQRLYSLSCKTCTKIF